MRENLENQRYPYIGELVMTEEKLPTSSEVFYKRNINLYCLRHYRWVFCFLQLNVIITDHTNQVISESLELSGSYLLSVRSKVG